MNKNIEKQEIELIDKLHEPSLTEEERYKLNLKLCNLHLRKNRSLSEPLDIIILMMIILFVWLLAK